MSGITDINQFRRQREGETREFEVFVQSETDPECANRTYFVIGSESREAVQNKINAFLAEAESFGGGYGTFDGPHRFGGIFFATGHTVSYP
jgi:hypothetical protein